MNEKELLALIQQGEGYNLEFKESLSENFGKEICAFANANGGKILMGVTDKGEQKGIEITNRLKSQIQDISRNFDPKFEVFLEQVGNVLIVHVPEGTKKPYAVKGHFYMRQGANSQQLTRDEIREFFQKEGIVLFDEKVNYDFNLEKDFNAEAFKIFLQRSGISTITSKDNILNNLELLKDKHIKNAGILLFCHKVTKFFMNATIMCVLFQGKDRYKILDSQEFNGDLYSNYENAVSYLKSKLNTEYIIKGGPREEKLELPEEALREAILNSIAHRNYFTSGHIQINIFQDRVEITNPGGLVAGLSPADLGRASRPRNTLLFGLMHRMDLIEKAGTGINRMNSAMKRYGLKKPIIEPHPDTFYITFMRPNLQESTFEDRQKRLLGVPENVLENVPQKRQSRIIIEIKGNPRITVAQLASKLETTEKTIKRDIVLLKKKRIIKRVGPDKGGYWEIIEK